MSTALAVCHGSFGRATVYRLDRHLSTHVHREGHLVFFVRGARPQMTIREKPIYLGPGDAAAVNPWEPHAFIPCPSGDHSIVLLLYIDQRWFANTTGSSREGFRFGRPDLNITLETMRYVQELSAMLLKGGADHAEVAPTLCALTLACSHQSWRHLGEDPRQNDAIVEPRCSDGRVRKALQLMSQHIAGDVHLDEIAIAAGLSRPHFFKLFKDQTGITPNLYMNTLRMECAIENLTATSKSVTEIGYDLGFASQASFTRFFCMNVGIAPSDYRRVAVESHVSQVDTGNSPGVWA